MSNPAPKPRSRLLKRLLIGAAAVAVIVPVAGYLVLSNLDLTALTEYARHTVKEKTGRNLRIEGGAEIGFGLAPTLTLEKVTLSNPDWAKNPALFAADRLTVRMELLPLLRREVAIQEISAQGATLALEKDAGGNVSWELKPGKPKKTPAETTTKQAPAGSGFTPRIGPITLTDTTLTYEDHPRGKPLTLTLPSLTLATHPTLTLEAALLMENLRGDLTLQGAELAEVMQRPLHVTLNVRGEDNAALTLQGKIKDLEKTPSLEVTLDAHANSLDAFSALAGATLPATQAVALQATLSGSKEEILVDNIKAQLGETNASGRGRLSLSGALPMISASLAIPSYTLSSDRAASPAPAQDTEKKSVPIPENQRVIPEVVFPSRALSAVNADIEFTLGEIKTSKTTLNSAMGHLVLKGGILQIDPVQFKLGEDLIKGRLAYNSRAKTPVMDMSFATQGNDLGAFLTLLGTTKKVSGGTFQGSLDLKGQGGSLREMLPNVSGTLSLVTQQTTLKDPKLQEATEFANLLQGKERSGDVHLNCALGKVHITGGIGTPEYLVADMKHVRIYGEGSFELPTEHLALTFYPQPKSSGFAELSFPVKIKGNFANPKIKPDRTQAAFSVTKMFVDSKKLRSVEALFGKGGGKENAQQDMSGIHPCLTPLTVPAAETTPSLKDSLGSKKEGVKEDLKNIEDDVRGLRDGLKGLLR